MSTQPKALALADKLNSLCVAEFAWATLNDAANELRLLHAESEMRRLALHDEMKKADRLHALNAQMLEALEAYIGADRQDQYAVVGYDVDGHPVSAPGMARIKARAAIKAAKGQA